MSRDFLVTGKTAISIAMIALVGLFATSARSVTANFEAITQGTFHATGDGAILSVHVEHPQVSGAPFSLAALIAEQTVDLAAIPSTLAATFTFTNASGHHLYGTYHGTAVQGSQEGALISEGTFIFSGGTGSFDGASGQGTYHALIQFTGPNDGTSSIQWTGSLSGPNLPGSDPTKVETAVTMRAGTVFNLSPVFDANGAPVFPWLHEVRGIVQASNLGNCVVGFNVSINSGADCAGNHAFCLSGTMNLTTLEGDKLYTDVVGWADPDPNDPKASASMFTLHYDVTITGGTGKLAGSGGQGLVTGAFMFSDTDDTDDTDHSDNVFCNSYAGVATWYFEGTLLSPAPATGPSVAIEPVADGRVTVSWPASTSDWKLQHTDLVVPNCTWNDVTSPIAEATGRMQMTLPAATGQQYFRLHKP